MAGYNMEFKTARVGGYDKEDVQLKLRELIDKNRSDLEKLMLGIKSRDSKIEALQKENKAKTAEIEKLNSDITEKYQSYIDNYETIGKLIYDSKLRANEIIAEGEEKKAEIIKSAEKAAEEAFEKKSAELDLRLAGKRRKYAAIQEEIDDMVEMVNEVQKKFMYSFKAVHKLAEVRSGENVDDADDYEDTEIDFSELEDKKAGSDDIKIEEVDLSDVKLDENESANAEKRFSTADLEAELEKLNMENEFFDVPEGNTTEFDSSFRSFLSELAEEEDSRQ